MGKIHDQGASMRILETTRKIQCQGIVLRIGKKRSHDQVTDPEIGKILGQGTVTGPRIEGRDPRREKIVHTSGIEVLQTKVKKTDMSTINTTEGIHTKKKGLIITDIDRHAKTTITKIWL